MAPDYQSEKAKQMASFSDILGAVITGVKDVAVARANAADNAAQYENAALRESVKQAEASRARELTIAQQFQTYLNQSNAGFMKILNVLLITVAGSLIGVIFINVMKKRG